MGRQHVDYTGYNPRDNTLLRSKVDFKMYGRLIDILEKNKFTAITVLKSNKNRDLVEWIESKTPRLSEGVFEYTLGTRLVWVITGLTDFPRCANPACGKTIGVGCNVTMTRCYNKYCCNTCVGTDPEVICKKSATCQKNFGVNFPMQSAEVKATMACNLSSEWGSDIVHPSQIPGVSEKMAATRKRRAEEDPEFNAKVYAKVQATRVKNGHPENWNNREQASATYKDRTGYDWPMQNPATQAMLSANSMKTYGVPDPKHTPEADAHRVETCLGLYGVPYIVMLPEVQDASAQAVFDKYGVTSVLALPEIRAQIMATLLKDYGVPYAAQIPEVKAKAVATRIRKYGVACVPSGKYEYDGVRFDSKPELYFYAMCRDLHMEIRKGDERDKIRYEYLGEEHWYYPDFVMADGKLAEVKGMQFFRKNGTMCCPKRKTEWSDERYEYECGVYEAKRQCMLANGVTILKTRDPVIKFAERYATLVYGKTFADGCRIKKAAVTRSPRA